MKDFIRSFLKIKFVETVWCRIVQNKTYGLWYTKLTPNHYTYSNPTFRKVNRKGINYLLNISNIVDWNLYFGFKEISKERLFELHKSPRTIIDAGANIGEITLNFANRFPNAMVYGFEPFPETFEVLKKNVALNNFQNVSVQNVGLGASESEVFFEEREKGNPGMNRVTNIPGKSTVKVPITTLHKFALNNQLTQISIIKIDVEGYEFQVLQGAQRILKEQKPALFIELDDNNLKDQGSSAAELILFLSNLDYSIRNAETSKEIQTDSDLSNCHLDIICN